MTGSFQIKGWLGCSFVDWPGRLASVIFLAGCNFRCPFCHNHPLVLDPDSLPDIPLDRVLGYCQGRPDWVDGVVISGGEPTLHPRLPELLDTIRRAGLAVKLDTNGSRPGVLKALLDQGLVDAVAMDIKAPFLQRSYDRMAGVHADLDALEQSVDLILASGIERTFRTTVAPGAFDDAELEALALTVPGGPLLQAFRPAEALDPAWRGMPALSEKELGELTLCMKRRRLPAHPALAPVAA